MRTVALLGILLFATAASAITPMARAAMRWKAENLSMKVKP